MVEGGIDHELARPRQRHHARNPKRKRNQVFTGFGERGVAAEAVADQAVVAARRYLASDVAVGEHLADQLLPVALARGGSFTTVPPSRHTTTNIEIIRKFLDVEIGAEQKTNRSWMINVK